MDRIEEAAQSLHKSMKGFGTDEARLIKEIVNHRNADRQLIKAKYMTMYGKVRSHPLAIFKEFSAL